jgi:haloacetate dehalogenase
VQGAGLPCGHYVPDHAPDAVLDWFLRFFGPHGA